jgi:hypothetical protein
MKKETIEILKQKIREEKLQHEIREQDRKRDLQLEQEEKDILIPMIKDFFKDIPTDHEFIIWLDPNIRDLLGYEKIVIDNYNNNVDLYLLHKNQKYYRVYVSSEPYKIEYPSLNMLGVYQLKTIHSLLDWIEQVLVNDDP